MQTAARAPFAELFLFGGCNLAFSVYDALHKTARAVVGNPLAYYKLRNGGGAAHIKL